MKISQKPKRPRAQKKLKAPGNASSHVAKTSRTSVTHTNIVDILPRIIDLRLMLQKLKPHDHLCLIYDSSEECRSIAIPFITIGLKRGEKCIYVVDTSTANHVRDYLKEEKIDVSSAEKSGQLFILHETDAYTKKGSFDPDRMIALLISETEKAIAEGYSALRVTGEASWVLRGYPGSERLLEYEAKLNQDFFPKYPCLAICQYDRWKFDSETIKDVIMTHPLLLKGKVIYRNPHYIPPQEFLSHKRAETEAQRWLNYMEYGQQSHETPYDSEIRYRILFERTANPILVIDTKGNYIDGNEAALSFLECNREELLRKNVRDTIPPGKEKMMDKHIPLWRKGGTIETEYYVNGKVKTLELTITPGIWQAKPVVFGVGMDITEEHRQAEEALRDSKERFGSLANLLPQIVFECDEKGNFIFANRQAFEITGYTRGDLAKGLNALELIAPQDRDRAAKNIKKRLSGSKMGHTEYTALKKDGSTFPISIYSNPIISGNKLVGLRGIIIDMTEQKRAEEELKLWSQLLDSIIDLVLVADLDSNIIYSNEAAHKLTGFTREELMGMKIRQLNTPESDKLRAPIMERLIEKGKATFETTILRKDGSIMPLEVHSRTIKLNDRKFTLNIARDITDRKLAEEALSSEVTRRHILVDQSRDGIVVLDQNGKVYEANQRFAEMLGYSPEEIRQLRVWDWDTQWTREQLLEMIRSVNEAGDHIETYHRRKDGTIYDVEISTNGAMFGEQKLVFCVCRDISERKKAEEELRQNEQKYQNLIEGTRAGIASIDITGKFTFINKALYKISGYSEKDLIGNSFADFVHPDDKSRATQLFLNAFAESRDKIDIDLRVVNKDGQVIYIHAYISQIKANNETIGFNVVITDITERKKMEEYLEKERQELELILDSSPVLIFYKDKEGRFVRVNYAFAEALQMPAEKFIGKTVFDLYSAEIAQSMTNGDQDVLKSGRPKLNIIGQYESASGLRWVQTDKIPIFDNGNVVGLVGFAEDITERKQAEEQYQTIVQTTVDGFWVTDLQGHFLDVNDAYCRLTGYSREELLKMSITDIEAKEAKEETAQHIQRIIKSGGDRFETLHRRKDGKIINVEVSDNYSDVAGGRMYIFLRDITERKKAEAKLLKSRQQLRNLSARLQFLREEERTNLAREIHDELGQAMTALKMDLSWLSDRLPQGNDSLLKKAESMSQVIDATMQTVRRMSTELRPGLLDDLGLVAAMEWQAEEFKKRTGINCSTTFYPQEIDIEQDMATAFFRIFQEVLTNIARHARATSVTASFRKEAGILDLIVSDNGRGITRDEISSSKSLGLTGIRERASYFRGTVEIRGTPGKGTTVRVRIPVKEPTRR